jgi:hypothetical protein
MTVISTKNIGRIVGVMLLLIIAAGATSLNFRGLSSSLAKSADFLNMVHENAMTMRIAILLNLLATGMWVGIAVMLNPLLSKYSKRTAHWFLGFWFVSFAVTIVGDISHLSLISLSELFVSADHSNMPHYQTLAALKVSAYYWSHFFALITYATATAGFFYLMYQSRLVPRFIAVWGMLAMSLVFFASWAQIFGVKVSFYFYMQNGLHMLFMTGWLLVKGFNAAADEQDQA